MRIFLSFLKKLIILAVSLFFLYFILSRGHIYKKTELEYGVTFSKKQAIDLELDWKEVYSSMLDDLYVRKLRISAYWEDIEKEKGEFYWDDLDWQVETAKEKDADIILAVGGRLPRWPECHYPEWVLDTSKDFREEKTLDYIRAVVERYKNNVAIAAWQVENEPFLRFFGHCPEFDSDFLDKEIALVRGLDNRPVVITDSGELSTWVPAAKRADIFGTTMYRDTYSNALKRYVHYPITPGFFRLKKNLVKIFAHPKEWIVIELQGEPWGPEPFQDLSKEEREKTMDLQKFKDIIQFSSQTGFKTFYLWGVEWWYWEKEVNGDNRMWEQAKELF